MFPSFLFVLIPIRRLISSLLSLPRFTIRHIVSSLFIPFLAATLLYLNNRVKWDSPLKRNGWGANITLVLVLVFFVVVALRDTIAQF